MIVHFIKNENGLVPANEEASLWFGKIKAGQVISVEAKKTRNYHFLKKYFALLNLAFDNWKAPEIQVEIGGKFIKPEKNFNRFRKDLTILCGYYETVFRLDGSYRIEPLSISFAKMEEEEFAELFQKTITVLIEYVYKGHSIAEVEKMVDLYLGFA